MSISSYLNTAMTIDQQENSAQDNYNYEKEQLGAMYQEQKQALLDSAAQALPFGVAEVSRAVAGAWGTVEKIQNFKAKYSPQLEEFKTKAAALFDNVGKGEAGAAVDYGELLKTAGTDLGRKALALAAPEVLKRTGVDLNKAVELSKGEGGITAGLENLKSQGVNIGKERLAGLVETGTALAKTAVAPVVEAGQSAIELGKTKLREGQAAAEELAGKGKAAIEGAKATALEVAGKGKAAIEGAKATALEVAGKGKAALEGAKATALEAVGKGKAALEGTKEAAQALVDRGKGILKGGEGGAAEDAVFSKAQNFLKSKGVLPESLQAHAETFNKAVETYKTARTAIRETHATAEAAVLAKKATVESNLAEAQAKVERLTSAGETSARGLEVAKAGENAFRGGFTAKIPGRAVARATVNPALEAAKNEVATHTEALKNIAGEHTDLVAKSNATLVQAQNKLGASMEVGASKLLEAQPSLLAKIGSGAKAVGGVALGLAGDAAGVAGFVQATQAEIGGHLNAQQGVNAGIGDYFGAQAVKSLAGKAPVAAGKLQSVLGIGEKKIGQKAGETVVEKTGEKAGEKVAETAAEKVGATAAKSEAENLATAAAEKVGEKLGIGLGEQAAEIGAAAAGASAVPFVGEALDIGLGLYSAISAIKDLFSKPPAPPPPPPIAQQVVSVTHQAGVY